MKEEGNVTGRVGECSVWRMKPVCTVCHLSFVTSLHSSFLPWKQTPSVPCSVAYLRTATSLSRFPGSHSANQVGLDTYLKGRFKRQAWGRRLSVCWWDEEQRVGLKVNFVINKLANK